jgi:tryptophanyl-tRNA synthetase
VFSGVQPTGNLHLGNYLGAIRAVRGAAGHPRVHLLRRRPARDHGVAGPAGAEAADPRGRRRLHRRRHRPEEAHIVFNQSQVSQHAELAWIFNCVARIGWMNRMTQFKDKAGKDRENASLGLFAYPNLMAADILLYKATHVPVGDDQKQHLELARDIAAEVQPRLSAEHGIAAARATATPSSRCPSP